MPTTLLVEWKLFREDRTRRPLHDRRSVSLEDRLIEDIFLHSFF